MAKVLVVDDEPNVRRIVAKAAASLGHGTLQMANGREAWEALQADPGIDLLITDIVMPEMDGRELVRKLRGDPARCNLPVLLISAVMNADAVMDLLDGGALIYQDKPLRVDMLLDNIRLLLPES